MAVLGRQQIAEYATELGRMMQEEGLTEDQIIEKVGKDLAAVSADPTEAQENLDKFMDIIGPEGAGYTPESKNLRRDIGMSYGSASAFGTKPGAFSAPGALDTGIATVDTGDTGDTGITTVDTGDTGTGGVSQVTFYLMPDGTVGRLGVGQMLPAGATMIDKATYLAALNQTGGGQTGVTQVTFYQNPDGTVGRAQVGEFVPAGATMINEATYLAALNQTGGGQTGAGPMLGTMATFDYTDFPGGIYGPGQALPNIFTPVTPGAAPETAPPAATPGAVPPAAPGPTTMVSPAVTSYSYPNPFSGVNIFERPQPTPYVPPVTTTTNNNNNNT